MKTENKTDVGSQKPEAGNQTSGLRHPASDRMIRKPATTRDVLGRDPKFRVMAGGTGKLIHLRD